MNRGEGYQEAKDGVKIGHFTEKGIDFTGVIHVGTNDGYEIQWYRQLGLLVVGFEPLESAFEKCKERYGADGKQGVLLFNWGIGQENEMRTLHETVSKRGMDDSGGTSFLKELEPCQHTTIKDRLARLRTAKDSFAEFADTKMLDCLVVDVQGMELDVLKSFDDAGMLQNFKGLNIECSRKPCYEGEAPADDVIAFLTGRGFRRDSPIEDHNDILFIRSDFV